MTVIRAMLIMRTTAILVLAVALQMGLSRCGLASEEQRLQPKRLLSLLNLDTVGMEEVNAAVEAKDLKRAEEELLRYMRQRNNVKTLIPWRERQERKGKYASKEDMEIADDALRHVFGGHAGDSKRLYPAHQFDKDIDWKYNPVKDREWVWHLNMMHFWRSLAKTYWHTGNEDYAREFFRQIDDWIREEPPNGNMTTWRKIDAGIRIAGPWADAYFHCLTSPSLTPQTHTRLLLGFHEHGAFLHSRRFSHENHGLFEARGLFFVSVLFPEFKESEVWQEKALGHLTREILKQVGVDGGHMEKCPSYHSRACLRIFESTWDLSQLNGIRVPESYSDRLEKMYEWSMLTSLPDGTAPRIGDTWHQSERKLLEAGAKRFQRKDMEYVGTTGARGTMPKVTSVCLKPSGFCVMRDRWDENAQYLLLKWRHGGWHSHFDDLSIILASGGRVLLDDSSTIDYHGGGRPKSRATSSHSTIAIDGKDRPSELNKTKVNQWLHTSDIDYIDTSGPASRRGHIHRRRIAYVRGKYWVMLDDVRGQGEANARVDMYFQFAPSNVVLDGLTARTQFEEGANLMVKVLEVPGLVAQREEGWIAVEYKVVEPRPRIRLSVERLPVTLVTLLSPYEGRAPSVAFENLELTESADKQETVGLRIRIDHTEDLIFFAPAGREFSYCGRKVRGPVTCLPATGLR